MGSLLGGVIVVWKGEIKNKITAIAAALVGFGVTFALTGCSRYIHPLPHARLYMRDVPAGSGDRADGTHSDEYRTGVYGAGVLVAAAVCLAEQGVMPVPVAEQSALRVISVRTTVSDYHMPESCWRSGESGSDGRREKAEGV